MSFNLRGVLEGTANKMPLYREEYYTSTIGGVAAMYATSVALGNPDMMVGPIPVYQGQAYEVGRSNEELLYRAAHGQFFRQIKGSNVSVRIDLILTGPYRELLLSYFEGLYRYGRRVDRMGQVTDITKTITQGVTDVATTVSSKPLAQIYQQNEEDRPDTAHYPTFTVITRTDALFRMYLESFLYERQVKTGKNVIFVSLFARQYDPEPIVVFERTTIIENISFRRPVAFYHGSKPPPIVKTQLLNSPNAPYHKTYHLEAIMAPLFRVGRLSSTFGPNVAYIDWYKDEGPDQSITQTTYSGRDVSIPPLPKEHKQVEFAIRTTLRLANYLKERVGKSLYVNNAPTWRSRGVFGKAAALLYTRKFSIIMEDRII